MPDHAAIAAPIQHIAEEHPRNMDHIAGYFELHSTCFFQLFRTATIFIVLFIAFLK